MIRSYRAFTLIELLVVIAIIGVIATIVLASLSQSRTKSLHAAIISQVAEYEKALNLYHANTGVFPGGNTTFTRTNSECLGEGSTNSGCWPGATGSGSYMESALVPDYLPSLPGFDQGEFGSPSVQGCVRDFDTFVNTCTQNHFSIYFILEGSNQSCARYVTADASFNGGTHTVCVAQLDAS